MKKLSVIIVYLFLAGSSFSQEYIGWNRLFILKSLKHVKTGDFQKKITETEDSITMCIFDPARTVFSLTLYLNKDRECDVERRTTDCELCFQKYMEASLAYKSYEWIKINSTQYISSSSKRLLLETDTTKNYSFIIRQIDKKQYDTLMKN